MSEPTGADETLPGKIPEERKDPGKTIASLAQVHLRDVRDDHLNPVVRHAASKD